jgi:LmbE family N-acetylglucosaminyl deacetylase
MKYLILVPHQDDEMIGCFSIMSLLRDDCIVTTVFKGGGEPKPNPYTPDELHRVRCRETVNACSKLGVRDFDFLKVPRDIEKEDLKNHIKNYLDYRSPRVIFTIYPYDNHPDHMLLGSAMRELGVKAFGFIVQTTFLRDMIKKRCPTMQIKLTEKEYQKKVDLVDYYVTQKHFLPNVIRRGEYHAERFWRVDDEM